MIYNFLITFLLASVFSSPAAMPHGVLSLLKLKTMDFTDQVKTLLITGLYMYMLQRLNDFKKRNNSFVQYIPYVCSSCAA